MPKAGATRTQERRDLVHRTFFGRFFRALGHDECGGSAIELALAAPVLLLILVGTVEAAHLYLVQSELTSAARQAARRLAVNAMTVDQTEAFVRARLSEVTQAVITVDVASGALQQNQADLTVYVSVPMRDVMLFGFDYFLPTGSGTSTATDTGTTTATTTATTTEPAGVGPTLVASATMIKE